jgi:hypothetical protein
LRMTFTKRALAVFFPWALNRGARKSTSSVCHSPAGRAALVRGGMPVSRWG